MDEIELARYVDDIEAVRTDRGARLASNDGCGSDGE
jgi:hypothetical protein